MQHEYQEFLPKDEKLNLIKDEVSKMEMFFNRCFDKIFASTAAMAERDFNVIAE